MSKLATRRATITAVGNVFTWFDADCHLIAKATGWGVDGATHATVVDKYVGSGPGGWKMAELKVLADVRNVFGESAALAFAGTVQDGKHDEILRRMGLTKRQQDRLAELDRDRAVAGR